MSDTPTRDAAPDDVQGTEPRSFLRAEVDGRPVRFWIAAGIAIAVVTLGFGAWWVWGLGRGMPMTGDMNGEMAGSPVLVVPELADVPAEARDDVYVFTNGVEGMGPFGIQPDVVASAPGDDEYSPLRTVVLVTWRDENQARELTSADKVAAAADGGEIDLEQTEVVVNMPFLTWPGGQR